MRLSRFISLICWEPSNESVFGREAVRHIEFKSHLRRIGLAIVDETNDGGPLRVALP